MRELSRQIHELVSRRALLPLTRLQRRVRPAQRPALRVFHTGMRFRQAAAGWTEEQKSAWVLQALRAMVRAAARTTTYYRELFRRTGFDPRADFSFADFARLPVLEREDVQRAGRELISAAVAPALLRRDSTGGSTGAPTVVWLGPEETGWREGALEHYMERVGVPTGVSTAYLWGHHLDPVARATLRERYQDFRANVRWFDCFRLSPATLARYHEELERLRPACIIAYASALANLAEHLLERGLRANYPTRCAVTGAEKLLPAQRELITRAFGRPVHERYGSRDAGLMAFQVTPARTLDYEVDWANSLLEPETQEAESAILVTKLHADGMPMLRYRVGDVGRFPASSRPGHPVFVLHEVLGRETDRLWLPDGRWVTGLQIPHMMKDYPVREFMFVQRPDYTVELHVVPKSGFADDARRRIGAAVAANLPGLELKIVLVDSIPRTRANKWRPVVSEVEPPKGGGRA